MRTIKTTVDKITPMLENSNTRYIRLLDEDKNAVYPFNVKLDGYNKHLAEVINYVNSITTPNGRYFLEAKNVKASKGSTFYEVEKINGVEQRTTSSTPTQPQAQPLEENNKNNAMDHFSIEELIQVRIDNETLKLENKQLQQTIEDLNDYIDELENQEQPPALQDQPQNNNFSFLKDIAKELMPVADEYFKNEREKRQIELANIGLQKETLDRMNQPQAPQDHNLRVEPQNLSLEQLISMKESAPNEFYNWYAMPGNREYFEHLMQENERNAS